LTSIVTVTVVSLSPSDAMKSKCQVPTSAASGRQRNSPAPAGVVAIVARSPRSGTSAWNE
jgi:hypothetical protein